MNFIPNERCVEEKIKLEHYKYPIPFLYVKPKNFSENTKIFIFLGGLDSTNAQVRLMNYSIFDNHYLITYERMGSVDNKNKGKRWMYCYIKELKRVIEYSLNKFGNLPIYLIGESWGGGIAIAFQKKYYKMISGTTVWNIPDRVQDSSGRSFWNKIAILPPILLSILFGMTTYDPYPDTNEVDILSSNEFVRRIKKVNIKKYKRNNLSLLAAWWAIKPTWRRIKRILRKKDYHLFYIQSKEDKMMHFDFFNSLKKNDSFNKLREIEGGYHILSTEDKWGEELFKLIKELFTL